ncbi:hypothetical protein HDU93_003130 [Gonapodya sp. JEL0774]|nr:hypothetical protein HDU93_003130 [Gonapodya sp. JEL0774]
MLNTSLIVSFVRQDGLDALLSLLASWNAKVIELRRTAGDMSTVSAFYSAIDLVVSVLGKLASAKGLFGSAHTKTLQKDSSQADTFSPQNFRNEILIKIIPGARNLFEDLAQAKGAPEHVLHSCLRTLSSALDPNPNFDAVEERRSGIAALLNGGPPVSPDAGGIQQLQDMGFSRSAAIAALTRTRNNVPRAAEYLLSNPHLSLPDVTAANPSVPSPVPEVQATSSQQNSGSELLASGNIMLDSIPPDNAGQTDAVGRADDEMDADEDEEAVLARALAMSLTPDAAASDPLIVDGHQEPAGISTTTPETEPIIDRMSPGNTEKPEVSQGGDLEERLSLLRTEAVSVAITSGLLVVAEHGALAFELNNILFLKSSNTERLKDVISELIAQVISDWTANQSFGDKSTATLRLISLAVNDPDNFAKIDVKGKGSIACGRLDPAYGFGCIFSLVKSCRNVSGRNSHHRSWSEQARASRMVGKRIAHTGAVLCPYTQGSPEGQRD